MKKELYNFVVDNFFLLGIIYSIKVMFEFLIFEIHFFQNDLRYGGTTKIKVVVIDDIYNFAVENIFI
jgi:hypothetical protein